MPRALLIQTIFQTHTNRCDWFLDNMVWRLKSTAHTLSLSLNNLIIFSSSLFKSWTLKKKTWKSPDVFHYYYFLSIWETAVVWGARLYGFSVSKEIRSVKTLICWEALYLSIHHICHHNDFPVTQLSVCHRPQEGDCKDATPRTSAHGKQWGQHHLTPDGSQVARYSVHSPSGWGRALDRKNTIYGF